VAAGFRAMVRGSWGEDPLKLKHFWTCKRSRKFACFLIFGNAKNSQIFMLSCKKMLHKLHLGMIKCNFAVIGSFNVKTVADRYRHAAYHNKHW